MQLEILPTAVYTLAEVCQLLKISPATARRWLKAGNLRARKIGRAYRFLGRDLLACVSVAAELPEDSFTIFTPDHPLLKLAGAFSSGLGDLAENHDKYLAEILEEESKPQE